MPDWPAPAHVRAVITTRKGGFSKVPYDSMNLGYHVDDEKFYVDKNWEYVLKYNVIENVPQLISQVHGSSVIELPYTSEHIPQADGSFSRKKNTPCTILTADCLPVFLCNKNGTQVAALHAGWRGLAAGVLSEGVASFENPADVIAYLGPAICPACFEVGKDVVNTFVSNAQKWGAGVAEVTIRQCFQPVDDKHWLADLYQLARLCLNANGVSAIFGGEFCTSHQPDLFYSYRRDGVTGRMASIIWFQ